MTLKIEWRIKFRMFFKDLLKVQGSWNRALVGVVPPFEKVVVNERGVWIRVEVS